MVNLSELNLPKLEFLSRREIQLIEKEEFRQYNNSFDLMTSAGKSVARYVKEQYPSETKILLLLGPGNNGGDGYIILSELCQVYQIISVYVHEPKTDDAETAKSLVDITYNDYRKFSTDSSLDFNDFDLIIDAIFGIGLNSEPRPPYDILLKSLSETSVPVISVDLPSGIDCDENIWYGPRFDPKSVVTMEFTKQVMKNWDLNCDIVVNAIGFHKKSIYLTNSLMVKEFWKLRDENSHKGENGRVMVIGGSDEFTGAPVLTGKAVLRTGVDTLRIAVPETIRDIVAGYNQDFIVVKVRGERLNSKSFKKFRNLAKNRHDVVVMGMGLSNHAETQKFVRETADILKDEVTLVLDADAIRPFRDNLDDLKNMNAIITPHKAELRFLLQSSLPNDFDDLIKFVMETAIKYNLIILLKGKIDIITDGYKLLLNETGTSSMTVGGTGDVLAGIVAAVNCFVNDQFIATAIAAYIMGLAGEKATEKFGLGMLASDLIEEIPFVLKDLNIF